MGNRFLILFSMCMCMWIASVSSAQCVPDCQCASGGECLCGPACQQPHVAQAACEGGQCRSRAPVRSVLVAPIAAVRHVAVKAVKVTRNAACRARSRVFSRVRMRGCCN
jgi:hypothetical protein